MVAISARLSSWMDVLCWAAGLASSGILARRPLLAILERQNTSILHIISVRAFGRLFTSRESGYGRLVYSTLQYPLPSQAKSCSSLFSESIALLARRVYDLIR